MYRYVYSELNILCIFILLYVLIRLKFSLDQQQMNIAFRRAVVSLLILLALDSVWPFVDGRSEPLFRVCNLALNAGYLFHTGLASYYWYYFAENKLDRAASFSRLHRALILLPVTVLGILCVASFQTGWLFYVDATGIYHRGALHLMQPALACLYHLFSCRDILVCLSRTRSPQKRTELLNLLSFYLLPSLGVVASVFTYGLPSVAPFATLSLLMVFINFQSYQISTDGLTGVNNRRQFDTRLTILTEDTHRTDGLFLFLIDIDSFKQINDTFGHYEGDRALISTASLLKTLVRGRDLFLARYGGDEFALLYSCESSEDPLLLKREIERVFDLRNTSGVKYPLKLSIGIEEFGPDHAQTSPDLIAGADRMLYEEKRRRKAGCLAG